MERCVKFLFLLSLLCVLDVCLGVASTRGGRKFHKVEKRSDLWRFFVGQTTGGLTLGNTHLCLLSYTTKFLATRSGKVFHDREWCQREERFRVEFLDGGKVTLRPLLSDEYISCMDSGAAILQSELGEKQKWDLFINQEDDQLLFFNTYQNKYLVGKTDNTVRCDGTSRSSNAQFLGWRQGPQEAWTPREEGRRIRKFNNARGTAVRTFNFKKTIGVKKLANSEAKVRVTEPMVFGNGLAKKFKTGYISELQMEWGKEAPKVWQKATTVDATWDVEPGTIVTLYQAVGVYGPLEIYSDYIMVLEEEAGPTQLQEH